MTPLGRHIIGARLQAEGTTALTDHEPYRGGERPVAYVDATLAEVERAMELAQSAHPAFEQAGRPQRARLLRGIADAIENLGDALIDCAHAESGLPRPRLVGERARTTAQLRMFADLVQSPQFLDIRLTPATPGPQLRTIDRAIGPVVVFGASNFPLAFSVAGGDTASALAAGCPVIVKGHPAHPATSELVGRAIAETITALELPAGIFALLHAADHSIGEALVQHPAARAVGFTGSYRGGRALFDLAARRPEPIPVYAEMGSINPVFVLPGAVAADPAGLADRLGASVCLGVGQFCTKPGVVVTLENADTAALLGALGRAISQTRPSVMLYPGIARAYARGCATLGAIEGVEIIGRADEPSGDRASRGLIGHPHAFSVAAATFIDTPALREEVFGPATLVVRCPDEDRLLAVARSFSGQLTATLHATPDDMVLARRLMPVLEQRAGRIVFGGVPTGVEVCNAMHHGGPFPATTAAKETSVGTRAVCRFLRPVCYQDVPAELLPEDLRP